MMAFDFPASPTNGQQFTPAGGPTYTFNGAGWTMGSGVHKIFVGDVPPVNPIAGQLWWESDAGDLYVYYDDGNSQQWVQVNMGMALLAGYLPLTGGILSGDLTISKTTPQLILDHALDTDPARLVGQTNGLKRWHVALGDASSGFGIARYDDAGVAIDNPFYISRSTGVVTLQRGQLQFPATANVTTEVNTLDDYREGTWIPDLTFNGGKVGLTYTSRTGIYSKIGRTVHAWGSFVLSAKGTSTGNMQLEGLPFVGAGTNMEGHIHWFNSAVSMTTLPALHGNAGQSFCYFSFPTAGGVGSNFHTDANASNAFACAFSIHYTTNS